jgi:hypothetical protein
MAPVFPGLFSKDLSKTSFPQTTRPQSPLRYQYISNQRNSPKTKRRITASNSMNHCLVISIYSSKDSQRSISLIISLKQRNPTRPQLNNYSYMLLRLVSAVEYPCERSFALILMRIVTFKFQDIFLLLLPSYYIYKKKGCSFF